MSSSLGSGQPWKVLPVGGRGPQEQIWRGAQIAAGGPPRHRGYRFGGLSSGQRTSIRVLESLS